jgi:hypothetical protein
MKTWAKIGVGCLVVLVLCCVIGIVGLVATGKKVGDLFGGIGGARQMAKDVKAMEQLEKTYPFTVPENGEVTEAQVQAYIAAATKVKQAMAPYAGWLKEHEGSHADKKGDWKDVKIALTMSATLVKAMREGLEEAKMNSKEFHWIESEMRSAAREEGGEGPTDAQRQMVDSSVKVLEEQMNAPNTSPEAKAQIQGQVDKLKATLEAAGGPVSPNRALYLKYKQQIDACDLQEFKSVKVE